MKRALLMMALVLMGVSATSPLWVGWSSRGPVGRPGLSVVSGRITGDFLDHPWAGTVVYLGSEKQTLGPDGTFRIAMLPGVHILRVCCTTRFQDIYREVTVADSDVSVELTARPLLEIAGRVMTPNDAPLRHALIVSARLVGTNRIDRSVVYSDGTFYFHLVEGDWQIDLENLSAAHTVASMTLDGRDLRDQKFTIRSVTGPSLTLRITLK
jgi:hypothetical protein